jgi:PAS domain S-box-containing protein
VDETAKSVGAPDEGLLEAVLRHAIDGIILTELPSRRTLDVSDSMCALTGYSREELIGRTIADAGLVVADRTTAATQRTLAGLRGMYEFQMQCKNGQQRWAEVSIQPVGPNLVLSLVRDVSERWKVERQLRERVGELGVHHSTPPSPAHERLREKGDGNSDMNQTPIPPAPDFRRIFESLPGRYLIITPDLTMVAATDSYLAATVRQRHDLIGRKVFDVFPDNPSDTEAKGSETIRASFERVCSTLKPDVLAVLKYDIAVPGPNGDEFEVRYWRPVNSALLDEAGQLLYILNAVEDVTALVGLQEREAEVEKAATEIRKRTANISHELRNPLNAIIGFAELMLDDADLHQDEETRHSYLNRIHASGKDLLRTIDDVMMVTADET